MKGGEVKAREAKKYSYEVKAVDLAVDWDRRVALVDVRIGGVLICGVAVWRSKRGHLFVKWPSYKSHDSYGSYSEAVSLPSELCAEIEADVIAAYKAARDAAKKSKQQKRNAVGQVA